MCVLFYFRTVVRAMSEKPRTYDVLKILLRFHAFPNEVMGKYCLVECLVPVGSGAPPNHHAGDEKSQAQGQLEKAFHGKG